MVRCQSDGGKDKGRTQPGKGEQPERPVGPFITNDSAGKLCQHPPQETTKAKLDSPVFAGLVQTLLNPVVLRGETGRLVPIPSVRMRWKIESFLLSLVILQEIDRVGIDFIFECPIKRNDGINCGESLLAEWSRCWEKISYFTFCLKAFPRSIPVTERFKDFSCGHRVVCL